MILLLLLALPVCASEYSGCTITGSAVHCDRLSGKFLPKDNDGEIDSIFITNSDMTDLTSGDFSSYGNLDKILISNSLLGAETNILNGLDNLRSLKITNCSLRDGDPNIFPHNAMLEKLSLRGNKITKVTKDLVFHLQHLLVLDLSDNKIVFLEEGTFDHMTNLQEVNLEANALREVAPEVAARAGDHCVICRTAAEGRVGERADGTEGGEHRPVQRPCSAREATRCAAGLWLDYLWWRSPILTTRLRGNPLCDVIAQTRETVEALMDENRDEGGYLTCETETNKCLLHERRRLFLLEACGVEEDDNKGEVQQIPMKEIILYPIIAFFWGLFFGQHGLE